MRIATALWAVPLLCGCARACGLESEYVLDEGIGGAGGAGGGAGGLELPVPIAHYPLDEDAGTIAHDVVAGLEGLVQGGASWQPAGGKIAGALEFDGIDGRVQLGMHELFDFGPDDFSISLWMRLPTTAMQNENSWTVVQHGNVNAAFYRLFFPHSTTAGRRVYFEISDGSDTDSTPVICNNYFDDKQQTWFMFTAVRSNLLLSLYVNGLLWTETGIAALDASTLHETTLAMTPGGLNALPGRLDDVRFYDVALSAEQVAALHETVEPPWELPSCAQ